MGTRGAMIMRVDGGDKVAYNHFDSYPDGLGEQLEEHICVALKEWGLDGLKEKIRELRVVDRDSKPSAEDKKRAKELGCMDLGVADRSDDDWYCLTRHNQGKLIQTLQYGVITDSTNFLSDSLFCEWAYVINCDTEMLEVYRGFQREPHTKGRYHDRVEKVKADYQQYYPVALHMTIPFADLSDEDGKGINWELVDILSVPEEDRDEDWEEYREESGRYLSYMEELRNVSDDHIAADIGDEVYKACLIYERLERAGRVRGNGHHMAQQIAEAAVALFRERSVSK